MRNPDTQQDTIAAYGALLSMIEIGLGSLLHAVKAPFAGYILSLNQGFILSRIVRNHRHDGTARFTPLQVSNVAALLKSLSPAGERLGPMIAIAMQGLLFNAGTAVCGFNLAGACVGMALLSLWAYAQIILYYYLLFGKKLAEAAAFFAREISTVYPLDVRHIVIAVMIVVAAKVLIGMGLSVAAFTLSDDFFLSYRRGLLKSYRPERRIEPQQSMIGALKVSARDLLHPLFLATITVMAVFFLLSGSSWQTASFYLIRPLALGYVLFFLIRVFPTGKIVPWLDKTRFGNLSRATAKAFVIMEK